MNRHPNRVHGKGIDRETETNAGCLCRVFGTDGRKFLEGDGDGITTRC